MSPVMSALDQMLSIAGIVGVALMSALIVVVGLLALVNWSQRKRRRAAEADLIEQVCRAQRSRQEHYIATIPGTPAKRNKR